MKKVFKLFFSTLFYGIYSINLFAVLDIDKEWREIQKTEKKISRCINDNGKNRYSDVIPYEENRFKFDDNRYINASEISFDEIQQRFIQCQAPTPQSFFDHWLMVWQSDSAISLMLTSFIENNRLKANPYWPMKNSEKILFHDQANYYNPISVSLIGKANGAGENYIVYNLKLSFNGEEKIHDLIHLSSWIDNQTISALGLKSFIEYIDGKNPDKTKPILVHCSAGIGRAGTFVSAFTIFQAKKNNIHLKPLEVVKRLRLQRIGSVQSKSQYQLLTDTATLFDD